MVCSSISFLSWSLKIYRSRIYCCQPTKKHCPIGLNSTWIFSILLKQKGAMAEGQREQASGKELLQEWDQESCWQGPKGLFLPRILRVCMVPLQRPSLQEKKVPQVPAPGQRSPQLQGALAARGDTVQGTKLLLQHTGTGKEEEGSPFTTSHSDVSSFSSTTLPFQLGVLPQGTSWNMSRSEYCWAIPLPKSCLPNQPVAEVRALVRAKKKAYAACAALLQTSEHRANIQNESEYVLGRSHPQAHILSLWWKHLRPCSTTTECLWHIKDMAGTELSGDPLVLFLWTLVPWVYLKMDDSFNCSLLMALCVTSHCTKGPVCCRGLVWANFGIDLAWKKCFTQQDSGWFSFFHAGFWCSESPRQEVLSSNIRQMFLIVSQLYWLVTCSVKHLSDDTEIHSAWVAFY